MFYAKWGGVNGDNTKLCNSVYAPANLGNKPKQFLWKVRYIKLETLNDVFSATRH